MFFYFDDIPFLIDSDRSLVNFLMEVSEVFYMFIALIFFNLYYQCFEAFIISASINNLIIIFNFNMIFVC